MVSMMMIIQLELFIKQSNSMSGNNCYIFDQIQIVDFSMRKEFALAYKDLENLINHKEVITSFPISAQERHLQTLGNIILCNQQNPANNIQSLLATYKGSFSHLILTIKYCAYCMEKQLNKKFTQFTILKMLTKWVDVFESMKWKKDVRLYNEVIGNLELGICSYEEFIVYLNYISTNLTAIMKSGTEESKKRYSDLTRHPHLDSHDLIKFLNVILPKVLINITVPRLFFPATLIKNNEENVNILYSIQTIENIAQNRSHYNLLLRTIMKTLLTMQLQADQIKQLILSSFKYYYIFHHNKNYQASQFVTQSLKKITSAIRFAISDQISLFIVTLAKLGKQIFIRYLTEKFQWVNELKTNAIGGISRDAIKMFCNESFGNSQKIKIEAGKSQYYYIQIYDRFSFFYFKANCDEGDISIRFYNLGPFTREDVTSVGRILLFSCQRKEKLYQGSVELVEKGIYMFEFDNTHSWMKGKVVTLDIIVLVPLEIKDQKQQAIKQYIFQKQQHLNEVLPQNMLGWIDEQQIKANAMSGNVALIIQDNIKIYELKVIRNTGQIYHYETELKERMIKKLKHVENDHNIFWLIEGCKVKSIQEVYQWINSELDSQRKNLTPQKNKYYQEKMMEEEISQQITEGYTELKNKQDEIITEQQTKISQGKQQSPPPKDQGKEEKLSALTEKKQVKLQQQVENQKMNSKQKELNSKIEPKIQEKNCKQVESKGEGEKAKGKQEGNEKVEKVGNGEHKQTKDQQQK